MAVPASSLRTALLVLLSLGLTLALGLLLPEALKLLFSVLGFPCDNASHAIVLVYFVFMLFVAMPALPRGTVPIQGKAVLITGCDSGFGLALAKHLHNLGFTVFAGCLLKDKNGEGAKELQSLCCHHMKVLQLNVCSQEEVTQAVEFVAKNLEDPSKGLWGLVNNAGISTFGDIEFTSLDTYKEVAEVNLWGTIRVTKAFLPLVRESKGIFLSFGKMGQKRDLTGSEKSKIVRCLAEGCSSLEIAKLLNCNHRTIKRFMANSQQGRKKHVGQKRRKITAHELRKIKREAAKMPFTTSFAIFQSCNVTGVTKSTRCAILRDMAEVRKAEK
ncbi:D-beta-hydroxybutyrate dehydrogenase, mitochondrial-like isoform X2 [Ranitomeya imitator]|uniref:D-beta-hydroxybutyrate dehydrogenase, mitochondrial-like isoform X2 n=1 Tax=Ranitomeya imitator TaxID=111125 RepID=UPI0037E77A61